MKPALGDSVHYSRYGVRTGETRCCLALITEVPQSLTAEPLDGCPNGTQDEWIASVVILAPNGYSFEQDVPRDEVLHEPGTWHSGEECD